MSSNLLSTAKFRLSNFFYHNWLSRYYHTLRYLRWEQYFYRAFYPIKRIFIAQNCIVKLDEKYDFKDVSICFPTYTCDTRIFDVTQNTITLINLTRKITGFIDWNNEGREGMLWLFHLHYFDWLNDPNLSVEYRLSTINQYIDVQSQGPIFQHSYPCSWRIINWIKFLVTQKIDDRKIDAQLYRQANLLYHFPEYEIQGNHLMQNGIALFWAALYFKKPNWEIRATTLLFRELKTQILEDGAHFEKSYAYQSQILRSILDTILLCKQLNCEKLIVQELVLKSRLMLSNLNCVKNIDGFYPNFGDSNRNSSINFNELDFAARNLGIYKIDITLKESGIRKFLKKEFSVYINTGTITATFQPGHSHSDALTYCLDFKETPVIVDRGVSTYSKGKLRDLERSSAAHNVVVVDGINTADVWASFRMGKRAKIKLLKDDTHFLALMNCSYFSEKNVVHSRSFFFEENNMFIIDELNNISGKNANSYIHFAPNLNLEQTSENTWNIKDSNKELLQLQTNTNGYTEIYQYCVGFNVTKPALRLVMTLSKTKNTYKFSPK